MTSSINLNLLTDISLNPRTRWEGVAASKWGRYVTGVESDALNKALAMGGTPGNALEVGCEGGRWSKALADIGWSLTCVDVDSKSLDICRAKVPGARCILARPEDKTLPVSSGSVSLLLCIEVAPVIDSNWFLAEAARVLQPGGIMVATAWNSSSYRGLLHKTLAKMGRENDGDYYRRTYSSFKREALENGFLFVEEKGFCWGPFGRLSDSALVPGVTALEKILGLNKLVSLSPWVTVILQKLGQRSQSPARDGKSFRRFLEYAPALSSVASSLLHFEC